MSHRQKKALEITLRDALDGMEALASLYAYRRLPEDLEILGIGEIEEPQAEPQSCAEIIELSAFRPATDSKPSRPLPDQAAEPQEKSNKIIVL
jgi:hypothetical protein